MRKIRLTALLAALLLLSALPLPASAAARTGLEGKRLSILGDSISTYSGVSNNGSRNSTISRSWVYYTPGLAGVYLEDTWWQQAADDLGLQLLVNNSWSGSCMYMEGAGTKGAFEQRCVQLHNGKGVCPDIIAVFMGTNDQDYFTDSLGRFEDIDFGKLFIPMSWGYTYAQPQSSIEAYAIALHKMQQRYPNAEIYCFTLLQRPEFTPFSLWSFNTDLKQLASHMGVTIVDLERCGVMANPAYYDLLMADYVHPNACGMDAITAAFTDALLTNSRYVAEDVTIHSISYDLKGAALLQGTARAIVDGTSFRADLAPLTDPAELTVTITMGGKNITSQAYKDGCISIEAVTGDLHIAAAAK